MGLFLGTDQMIELQTEILKISQILELLELFTGNDLLNLNANLVQIRCLLIAQSKGWELINYVDSDFERKNNCRLNNKISVYASDKTKAIALCLLGGFVVDEIIKHQKGEISLSKIAENLSIPLEMAKSLLQVFNTQPSIGVDTLQDLKEDIKNA